MKQEEKKGKQVLTGDFVTVLLTVIAVIVAVLLSPLFSIRVLEYNSAWEVPIRHTLYAEDYTVIRHLSTTTSTVFSHEETINYYSIDVHGAEMLLAVNREQSEKLDAGEPVDICGIGTKGHKTSGGATVMVPCLQSGVATDTVFWCYFALDVFILFILLWRGVVPMYKRMRRDKNVSRRNSKFGR